ncbi:hypothetical protein R1flu_027636 [Riccia fluitans]|uniref:SURP and G-patch domain-containing protein 1-like protein n=1 Tax=Riccia fluitans TaxID=41844 RepID=A0ABD1XK40_9MARC
MSGLFVNDGSFMERFQRLQQEQEASKVIQKPESSDLGAKDTQRSTPVAKMTSTQKPTSANGKLAFSLKQKSRLAVNAIKLGADEDEEAEEGFTDRRAKKMKAEKSTGYTGPMSEPEGGSVPAPSDPEVKKVADKLASFVAVNGRQFENITRQRNPGDTPFRFLFDINSPDYKYYEYRVAQEQRALVNEDSSPPQSGGSSSSMPSRRQGSSQKTNSQQRTNYSIPASALYSDSKEDRRRQQRESTHDSGSQSSWATDSVSMMDFYMKKAAQEDLRKPARHSNEESPATSHAPASENGSRHSPGRWPVEEAATEISRPYSPPTIHVDDVSQGPVKKGHHMGDYIPPEELEKFMAKCNDAMAQKAAKAAADRAKIQADNVGHRLLSKMGWKEGEGLGSRKGGRSDPVQAGSVKLNNLGVGAEQPGEVTPDDDIYEQYKKRMMLGYRFRPNPLNNPRKAYY